MKDFFAFLSELDWSPLWISLKTGVVAATFSFFLGIFIARKVVKAGPKVRAVVDGFLTMPLVLPPTVAGFFLLLIFSTRRPFGSMLYETFGIKVVQTWLGCILAATVISLPLMYRNTRAAFEQIDVNLVYAARTLGMSETRIFWRVIMPAAGPGVVSGTILAFARALGEYGAEDCHGDPEWGLCYGRFLGAGDHHYCVCDCPGDESYNQQTDEERDTLLTYTAGRTMSD